MACGQYDDDACMQKNDHRPPSAAQSLRRLAEKASMPTSRSATSSKAKSSAEATSLRTSDASAVVKGTISPSSAPFLLSSWMTASMVPLHLHGQQTQDN